MHSTRGGIIDFYGGVPGVFGSLIRLSVDHCKWRLERHEWDEWLNAETFSYYLNRYHWTFRRIRNDLKDLSAEAWKVLESLLQDSHCCSEMGDATTLLVDMGMIVKEANSMPFSSEIMRRISMDAFSRNQVSNVDD
ncbi:hypothetical protein Ae201684P_004370 [Aphanomyces euteiches]|nr:hypothetical protein Ae201684P_004370 [Aphanomyces euteiches]